jgi:hypothetical protein
MGMAASQARYLSLSARKTNTEYEGQQLNQQRLNLANQTADLFNQMLSMSVPQCPDSNDFTKLQYAWSDGVNDEIISDFYQIAVPYEDYNYVVTSYRYENAYVGQTKRMNSPEIQHSKTNSFTDMPDKDYEVLRSSYHKESSVGAGDDSYTITVTRNGQESTHIFKRMDKTIDSIEEIDAFTKRTSGVTAGDRATYQTSTAKTSEFPDGYPATWTFEDQDIVFVGTKIGVADSSETGSKWDSSKKMSNDPAGWNMPYKEYPYTGVAAGTEFKKVDFDDENQKGIIDQLRAIYGDKLDTSKTYYYAALQNITTYDETASGTENVTVKGVQATDDGPEPAEFNVFEAQDGTKYYELDGKYYSSTVACADSLVNTTDDTAAGYVNPANLEQKTKAKSKCTFATGDAANVTDAAGNQVFTFICGEDMNAAVGSQGDIAQVEVRTGDTTAYYTDGEYILTAGELSAINLTDSSNLLNSIFFHKEVNNPTYSNFKAVGNCALSEVSIDSYNSSEDTQIEIQRVLADMKENGNVDAFANLSDCFDSKTGEYIGGIYSFRMYDHTYYTTTKDLETAVAGAYKDIAIATNGIDSQDKLVYYTSTQIPKKVEETKKALMETDGKGRFSSVKFEDDSTVYTLKCETVTDQDAYDNAMNQYFYKQEKYDKAISDLNARNEIIQAQDRELQLRLEQLGTEQTALQTEMEACQKVVSKSIESTFKTFGG